MTRKEKLVMEIAEVRYQLRTLKGQLAVSPEDYYNSRMYQLEVKNNKVYELEEQLKGLKESLEKAKLDTQIQQRTEAYYATEEGKAYIAFANASGKIRLVDGETGKILYALGFAETTEASPVVFGNMMVLGTREGIYGIKIS
jgi:hypothetical protein